ncbi:MAG: hypothetical protein ACYCTY_08855 [Sulfuricella sp.]
MKLKFKTQAYQTNAVESVADCFAGQLKNTGIQYRIDPGRVEAGAPQQRGFLDEEGFKNPDIALTQAALLENIHAVQRRQNLPLSAALAGNKVCAVNLDVEMETGTGKTLLLHQNDVRAEPALWLEQVHRGSAQHCDPRRRVQIPGDYRRAFSGEIRQARPLLYLQFQAIAQSGELFFRCGR